MFIEPRYKCDSCSTVKIAEWTGQPHWDIPLRWTETADDKHFCDSCVNTQCKCKNCFSCLRRINKWKKLAVQPSEWLTWKDGSDVFFIVCPRYGKLDIKLYMNNKLVASFASMQSVTTSDDKREILALLWANKWIKNYV